MQHSAIGATAARDQRTDAGRTGVHDEAARASASPRDRYASMTPLQALIFDVDGTLADTEEIHRQAFNRAFAEYSIPWTWSPELYGRLLAISGGRERIEFYRRERLAQGLDDGLGAERVGAVHARKTALYAEILRDDGLKLRPGVERLLRAARTAGLRLALATSSAYRNLETLLDMNLPADWRTWFTAIESCDTVATKKPSPAVYLAALRGLEVSAAACIAFEDTPNGLRAALSAGISAVVTTHRYTRTERFAGALLVTDGLGEPDAPCTATAGSLLGERCVTLALLRQLRAIGA